MQITFYLLVADSDWLRVYAARASKGQDEVICAAIARARLDATAPQYVEPGTSITQPGVVEISIVLPDVDARWLIQRAAGDRVTLCAVLGDVLRRYRSVAPWPTDCGWTMMVDRQTTFYRQIATICRDVSCGATSPDAADEMLGREVAIRLYGLLPDVPREQLREAVVAAIRELCVNHPGLRQAHGRETHQLRSAGSR